MKNRCHHFPRSGRRKATTAPQDRAAQIIGVRQRDGRTALQEDVAEHAPAEGSHQRQGHKPDEVEATLTGDHPAQNARNDDSAHVDAQEDPLEHLGEIHPESVEPAGTDSLEEASSAGRTARFFDRGAGGLSEDYAETGSDAPASSGFASARRPAGYSTA